MMAVGEDLCPAVCDLSNRVYKKDTALWYTLNTLTLFKPKLGSKGTLEHWRAFSTHAPTKKPAKDDYDLDPKPYNALSLSYPKEHLFHAPSRALLKSRLKISFPITWASDVIQLKDSTTSKGTFILPSQYEITGSIDGLSPELLSFPSPSFIHFSVTSGQAYFRLVWEGVQNRPVRSVCGAYNEWLFQLPRHKYYYTSNSIHSSV